VEILGDNINCGYRYNISVNDGWRIDPNGYNWLKKGKIFWVSSFCGKGNDECPNSGTFIYNNSIFVPNTLNPEIYVKYKTGDTHIFNNLIYVQPGGDTLQTWLTDSLTTLDVSHNLFYERSSFNLDSAILPNALFDDPLLELPGSIDPQKYKLLHGSPAISTGILINGSTDELNYLHHNGGSDFFGNSVSHTRNPNIGAYNGSGIILGVENNTDKTLSIFPNPTNGVIYLKDIQASTFKLFDLRGTLLLQGIINGGQIDISNLSDGIYNLILNRTNTPISIPVIKITL
jgi:hypothetical protein